MSPFQRPAWPLANGHLVRSRPEESVCQYLSAAREPHDHGSLVFEVWLAGDRLALYRPDIVLTQTEYRGRVILLEIAPSIRPGSGLRRAIAFREANAEHYFVALLARRSLHPKIPPQAYDVLLPIEDFRPLDEFLVSGAGP